MKLINNLNYLILDDFQELGVVPYNDYQEWLKRKDQPWIIKREIVKKNLGVITGFNYEWVNRNYREHRIFSSQVVETQVLSIDPEIEVFFKVLAIVHSETCLQAKTFHEILKAELQNGKTETVIEKWAKEENIKLH